MFLSIYQLYFFDLLGFPYPIKKTLGITITKTMLTNYQQNEKKFHCNQCSESFNRNFSLTIHTTVVHSEVKTLECNQSGKVYNLKGLVKCSTSCSTSTSINSQRNIEPTTKILETKVTQCAVL